MTEERAKIRAENKAIRADTERLKQIVSSFLRLFLCCN